MPTATDVNLESYRHYLTVLAGLHLASSLRGKVEPADIVQQVMLRAVANAYQLRNTHESGIAAWLRKILANTLADTVRFYETDKRAVELEVSLAADIDRSAAGFADFAADHTSPSNRAERNEEELRLAEALASLPIPQREVVVAKHLQGQTLQQISVQTGRSIAAVAGLLRRGLESLRNRLGETEQ